jgi:UDP-2-acetamido-2,6-beta-L-arabino-hexul-4-ose reductase
MKTILITGADGFMGRNLRVALERRPGIEVIAFEISQLPSDLSALAARADLVFHLAGVNRPQDDREFIEGNLDLTRELCHAVRVGGRTPPLVFSSSVQANSDSPYGKSKRAAEEMVLDYHRQTGAPVRVYRFPNVFGKWSRPNYNSVVATFCHNLSRGIPVQVTDRAQPIRLVYIDDVVRAFVGIAASAALDSATTRAEIQPIFSLTLGDLHDLLVSFRTGRENLLVPDMSDLLTRYLYSTYISFLDRDELDRQVELKSDDRGWLFELTKSPHAGQVFVSRTAPGVTRGNHYHDTKVEKFCVIQGEGIIRIRDICDQQVRDYLVNDRVIRIIDIPPGCAHSLENTGSNDMITLFWASNLFDPRTPEAFSERV